MNIINVGDPRTISLLAGQTISVTTTGTITATCVSGLGLTAGSTIGRIHGSTVFGPYTVDGVLQLTATDRDGAYELIASGATVNNAAAGYIDEPSLAVLNRTGYISTKPKMTIAILGDSISEGTTARIPLPEADTGWFADCSAGGSTFLIAAHCAYGVTASTAVLIDWDGNRYMRAKVTADGYGPQVDVTGGGYFALQTGSGKYVFVKIRWRNIAAAQVYSFTNQAAGTLTWCRNFSGDFFGGALAAAGMHHHTILNYGIGGDWAADVLKRVGQVIARGPDAVLLMVGRNDAITSSDPSTSIIGILDALTAAGIYVLYADTISSGYTAGAQASAWVNSVNYLRATIPSRYAGMVDMVDMAIPYTLPTGAAGTALQNLPLFAQDAIHASIVGTWGSAAQIGSNALKARFPNAQFARRVSGADAYNASTNPKGNLIGVRASLTGSAGTLGTGVGVTTLNGLIPTNWTESQAAGTFNVITYTEPSNASPIARASGKPGNYWRMVATNTSGSAASRYLFCSLETAPVAGAYHRFGITLRLSGTTGLTSLEVFMSLGGVANLSPSLIKLGAATPLTSATLSDSGEMVLVSTPYKMPAGVGSAALYIQIGCATACGFTLDIADPWVALA